MLVYSNPMIQVVAVVGVRVIYQLSLSVKRRTLIPRDQANNHPMNIAGVGSSEGLMGGC